MKAEVDFQGKGWQKVAFFYCYIRLFIVATGCPSQRRPRRWLAVTGDSARIQDETTENSAWFFNVLGV